MKLFKSLGVYKAEGEMLEEVQKERDDLRAALEELMRPELQIEATKGGYCIFRFSPDQVAQARRAIKNRTK